MKNIKKLFFLAIFLLLGFSISSANYIDKEAVKTSQGDFDVVVKSTNDYLNIKDNSISNNTAYNGYFLSKDINNKYVDLFSYGQPSLKIGSGYDYLLSSFYIFSPYQQTIKLKSYVKGSNSAIEDSLGDLYTTYNPTYLAYIAVGDAKAYSGTYDLNNTLKNYIDGLSYSDRVSLIQDIDSNGCKYISSLKLQICGFQKNPTKLTTEETYSGYQNINGYENDTSFLSNDITIQTGFDVATIGFVRDLYDGFNGLDSYNSSTGIQISFGIQGSYISPAFVGEFKDFFIDDVDSLLKEGFSFNQFITNLLRYYKAGGKDIGDLYTRNYINDGEEDKLYKYGIGYIELDKTINDNTNKGNWTYYFSNYIVNGSHIFFAENFDSNQNADVVVAKTNNDLLFCWSKTADNYVNDNLKLHNSNAFTFHNSCANLPDTTVSFGNMTLHKFYFGDNPSDEYKTYFNVEYENTKDYTVLIGFNNPAIFNRLYVPENIHSVVYVPNTTITLQNLTENTKVQNDIITSSDYVNNSPSGTNMTGYSIVNTTTGLILNQYGNLMTRSISDNYSITDKNFLKTLALYLTTNIQDLSLSGDSQVVTDRSLVTTKQLNLGENSDGDIVGQYYFEFNGQDYDLDFRIKDNTISFNAPKSHTDYDCDFLDNYLFNLDDSSYSMILNTNCSFNESTFDENKVSLTLPFKYFITNPYYQQNKDFVFNTYYGDNDLTKFKGKAFSDVVSANLVLEESNLQQNSTYNFLNLYDENKDGVLNKIIYSKKIEPKKDFVLVPNNKDTTNLIYMQVNDDNVISSDYIPNTDFYRSYIENLINYQASLPGKIYYQLDNSNHLNGIDLNKEYDIATYIVPNFNYAKQIEAKVVDGNGTYIKGLEIDCDGNTVDGTDQVGVMQDMYLITGGNIQSCKVILKLEAHSDEERNELENAKITVQVSITDNHTTLTKDISYIPYNPDIVNTNGLADIFLYNDAGNLVKDLTTKYNGFGAYIRYDIPDKSKKIKYVKISVDLDNPDFEIIPNPLLESTNYLTLIRNILQNGETIVRNKTHYDIIIPYDDQAGSFDKDSLLHLVIQLNKDLDTVQERSGKLTLNVKYVYLDGTEQDLTDEAKFKVTGFDGKDYLTTYIYNLENKDDPLFSSQPNSDGTENDNYGVWEINYFHLSTQVQAQDSQTRVPGNFQGDSDGIGAGFGAGYTRGWNLSLYPKYDLDYFPPYNGSAQGGYSIEDTYNSQNGYYYNIYTPNNYGYVVHGTCSTYSSQKQTPPRYDDGRGYGGIKTIKFTGVLKAHVNKIINGDGPWGDFIFPEVLYRSDAYSRNDLFTVSYSYNYYQTTALTHNKRTDANTLLPRIILAPEFQNQVESITWDWGTPINPSVDDFLKNNFKEFPFTITIHLKEENSIDAIKNNALYKLVEDGANKRFMTLQIPVAILGNYEGLDKDIVDDWKGKNISKFNDFIFEFLSQNQKQSLVNMQMSYQKYIWTTYSKGYLHTRLYDHRRRCCGEDSCRRCGCIIDSRGSEWIDQGSYQYKYGYSKFKSIDPVSNNYVVRVYRPTDKFAVLGNYFSKGLPSTTDTEPTVEFNDYNVPSEFKFDNQTELDNNKQLSLVNYLLKNKDFEQEEFDNYSYYNLKPILEYDNGDKRKIYYYKNATNLQIENTTADQIRYKGKKIIIVDGDLYLNTNLLPDDRNKDYLIVVVLGNLYINSKAEYADWGLIVKGNYILLDGEKAFVNQGPTLINGKVLNYRKAFHPWGDIAPGLLLTQEQEATLRSQLKKSLLFMSDLRFLKEGLVIKKIFSDKKF